MQTVPWESQWFMAMVLGILLNKNLNHKIIEFLTFRNKQAHEGTTSLVLSGSTHRSALQPSVLGTTTQRPVLAA